MVPVLALIWFFGTAASLWFVIRPKAGLPPFSTRTRAAGMAAGFFIGVPILAGIIGGPNAGSSSAPSSPAKDTTLATGESPASPTPQASPDAVAAAPSKWTYDESRDAMRNALTRYARVRSDEEFENSIGLGTENTVLEVQKRAGGYDVAVSNSNLQFTCNSFTGTHVSVKFDNGAIERYRCTSAVGDTFGVAFISAGDRFVAKLRKAERVVIEAEIFQRGDTQMSFDVRGLQL